jgi:hypothetical protein
MRGIHPMAPEATPASDAGLHFTHDRAALCPSFSYPSWA